MTEAQFGQLLIVLQKIAEKNYTLTGAADWPMLVVMANLVAALLGAMWFDLRGKSSVNDKEHDKIWRALGDCQDDCCPRGGKIDKQQGGQKK